VPNVKTSNIEVFTMECIQAVHVGPCARTNERNRYSPQFSLLLLLSALLEFKMLFIPLYVVTIGLFFQHYLDCNLDFIFKEVKVPPKIS
jgi:hypothetical protein